MKKDKKEKIYDKLMFHQAGSANDCTGLIPTAIQEKEELKAYEDVYNFSVPESVKEDLDSH